MSKEIRQSAFSASDKAEFTSHSRENVAVSSTEKAYSRRISADLLRLANYSDTIAVQRPHLPRLEMPGGLVRPDKAGATEKKQKA